MNVDKGVFKLSIEPPNSEYVYSVTTESHEEASLLTSSCYSSTCEGDYTKLLVLFIQLLTMLNNNELYTKEGRLLTIHQDDEA